MLKKMYDWIMREAASKRAKQSLFAVAFAESSFFPIPPDVMLIPMVLAQPKDWLKLVGIATVGSVIGGLFGYAIGYFLLDTVGQWIIHLYHMDTKLADFQQAFAEHGVMIILLKGLTPIPYKLVTIASGIAQFPLLPFILASIVTRAGRFALVAGLLRLFGDKAKPFIEKHLSWILLAVLVLVIIGFVIAAKLI
ncbi:MAG: YqaA family protein [Alphaproteobacteria bacterium]|nr:YqaA family protein [Alphaproteobacteria bacterium]